MKEELNCSFCGRPKSDTTVLIAGIDAHICDECIGQAYTILEEEIHHDDKDTISKQLVLKTPLGINDFLNQYVIGQSDAKKVLAVAVYNHYKRILESGTADEDDVELHKSNIILVGETGTGKTLLAQSIAKMLNVPFAIVDATILTEAGYVGEDVESIITRLLQAADYDAKKAERGIIFIDEMDKIARKSDNPSITRDVSGEGVQQAMLKLLEGSKVNVPPQGGRKHPDQKFIEIDTRNILFVAGGAFDGIKRHIMKRIGTDAIGYSSVVKGEEIDRENVLQYIAPQDLRSFGLIPELIGRLPVLAHLDPLDASALRRILHEPKNAIIKQYQRLFEIDGVELTVEDSALDFIVEKAVEFKLGARGLRSICEAILIDAMYELPSNKDIKDLTVDRAYAEGKLSRFSVKKLRAAS